MYENRKNKIHFSRWVEECSSVPIFFQPWWLDLVAGEEGWDVALAFDRGKNIIGVLPYGIFKRKGFAWIENPPLTPYSGPFIIFPPGLKRERKYFLEKKAVMELVQQLPSSAHFINLRLHHRFTNCLPMHWSGFNCQARYTYILKLGGLEEIFQQFSSNVKRNIKKAEKTLKVVDDLSPVDFYLVNKKSFAHQQAVIPYSFEEFLKKDNALTEKQSRKIFFAIDKKEKVHAAIYLVWDQQVSYFHMGGVDRDYRWSGAGHLLMWEAIKYSKNILGVKTFDFEGSMIESVENMFRQFGGEQKIYFRVFRAKNRFFNGLYHFFRG